MSKPNTISPNSSSLLIRVGVLMAYSENDLKYQAYLTAFVQELAKACRSYP